MLPLVGGLGYPAGNTLREGPLSLFIGHPASLPSFLHTVFPAASAWSLLSCSPGLELFSLRLFQRASSGSLLLAFHSEDYFKGSAALGREEPTEKGIPTRGRFALAAA